MEKFYPPFYINYILEKPDKTLVKVTFYEIGLEKMKITVAEKTDEFGMKYRENCGGEIKSQEVFELPKMSADEARKTIYSKFLKENITKRITI